MSEEIEEQLEEDNEQIENIEELNTQKYPIYNGDCKIFHNEPYMTPNNYDIFFDHKSIPSNIKAEPAASLQKRLQKLMPLTKYIHLNMESEELNQTNHIMISSKIKIDKKEDKFV